MIKFFLLLFLISPAIFADLPLPSDITDEKLQQLEAALPHLTEKKVFYHWGPRSYGIMTVKKGHLDKADFDQMNQMTGNNSGGGFYVAEDKTSSSYFGDYIYGIEVAAGIPIYDPAIGEKIIGRSLSQEELTAIGERIPFIRPDRPEKGWWVTHHPKVTERIFSVRNPFN